MALKTEAPSGVSTDMVHRQLRSCCALPSGLEQPLGLVLALCLHRRGEADVFWSMHHNLQLMAGLQQVRPRRVVAFGRQGDPVKPSAEGINAAGFQVDGQVDVMIQDLGQRPKVVMERFSTRDHYKRGSSVLSV